MKILLLSALLWGQLSYADTGVKGLVFSPSDCAGKVMVWLALDKEDYKERLLLMHTEVPVGGSFQFYLRPGDYQLRASDAKGCEYLQKITVKDKVESLQVRLVQP
jgi:hypothetical protein